MRPPLQATRSSHHESRGQGTQPSCVLPDRVHHQRSSGRQSQSHGQSGRRGDADGDLVLAVHDPSDFRVPLYSHNQRWAHTGPQWDGERLSPGDSPPRVPELPVTGRRSSHRLRRAREPVCRTRPTVAPGGLEETRKRAGVKTCALGPGRNAQPILTRASPAPPPLTAVRTPVRRRAQPGVAGQSAFLCEG